MKKLYYVLIIAASFTAACTSDNPKPNPVLPKISIENLSEVTSVGQKDTIRLRAVVEEGLEDAYQWSVDGDDAGKDQILKFVSSSVGSHTVTLSCTNGDGTATSQIELEVYPQFRHGTFILNEGNMSSENGSLIFISPQGVVEDSAYRRVNDRQLGNACQDMFIGKDKRMYIISQNGDTGRDTRYGSDGKLVVADSETLERIAAYNDELSSLSWPTNIASLDAHNVFIRDNNGVHHFDTQTKTLTFVDGSKGASKNRMAVVGDKVFVPAGSNILVLKAGQTTVDETITIGAALRGVIKSADGNIWAATSSKIMKINAVNYTIEERTVTEGSIGSSFNASPGISAIGNVLYYSGGSKKIYRYDFASQTNELLVNVPDFVENAAIQYNDLAVDPTTGQVWINTISGYATFLANNISVFDFGGEAKLAANYENYTHFPAGIYFTYNFE